jgi:tetratricopeptide (TPR) repeat protein
VAVYAARIWCAKALQEKGELVEAEELLQENLVGSGLTPASPEWRESLFELGQLLHADGRYKQAIEKLTEAVEREKLLVGGQQFPYERPVVLGLYTIAEAYRLSASEPGQRLLTSTIESDRQETRRQITGALEQAANYYAIVRSLINRRQETAQLAEWDQAILRNSYFSLGSVLFDLGRYNEAIEAYSDAEARYQNDPLVLEIFVQVANCYRRMDRIVEARGALERAKVVLKRLPADGAYLESTNYTREEWTDLLDRLSKW